MPANIKQTSKGPRWWFRKHVTLPNGKKVTITGMPEINTKKAAETAEREAITRVMLEGPAPIGRPLDGDEARTINLSVRCSPAEIDDWAGIAAKHGCETTADGVRLAMEVLRRARPVRKAGR